MQLNVTIMAAQFAAALLRIISSKHTDLRFASSKFQNYCKTLTRNFDARRFNKTP